MNVRFELFHRFGEVAPGILPPGIILVDPGDALEIGVTFQQIAGRRDIVHRRGTAGTKEVFRRGNDIFKDLRGAAVEKDGQLAQFFGYRSDRLAMAAGDIADHHIDFLLLDELAILGDLLLSIAGFVDEDCFQLGAGNPFGVVRSRNVTGVNGLDHEFRSIAGGNTERSRSAAGQEGDQTDFNCGCIFGCGRYRSQCQNCDKTQNDSGLPEKTDCLFCS